MRKISTKGKALIAVVAFLLITPLVVFYVLEETGVFDTRSQASLELTDEMKKGDLDGNEAIQIADYSIWLTYWRSYKDSGTYTQAGDLDQDGAVAISDFVIWLSLWNQYKALTDDDSDSGDNYTGDSTNFGTGLDGDAALSGGTVNLNEASLVGRGCADAISYSVLNFESSKIAVVNSGVGNCISSGDEVLIINLSGTSTSSENVGNYETLMVANVSGDRITFATAKTKRYGDGTSDDNIGVGSNNQKVILQRVPQYADVDIEGTLTVNAWNGTSGGVLFFKATGTVTLTGTITVEGLGYRGGSGSPKYSSHSKPGEGLIASSGTYGQGGAYHEKGFSGLWSGGGGAGGYAISLVGGDGSTNVGSIGGGGGGSTAKGASYQYLEKGFGAGGGGGGHSTGGKGGTTKYAGVTTGSAGTNSSSGGGGKGTNSKAAGTIKYILAAGGGGGGKSIGSTNLSKIFFGGAGGGGGAGANNSSDYAGSNGGNGGGIIILGCYDFVVNSGGYINANGGDSIAPSSSYGGSGGSGAGGSIKLVTGTLTLGSEQVTANAGAVGSSTGGTGSVGRIYIEYMDTFSGSSLPTAVSSMISE